MSVTFPLTSRVAITSGRIENTAEYREDFMAGRVSPPAAADGFTGDVFGKGEYGAACGLQDDALRAHLFQRLHDHRFNHAFGAVHQTSRLSRPCRRPLGGHAAGRAGQDMWQVEDVRLAIEIELDQLPEPKAEELGPFCGIGVERLSSFTWQPPPNVRSWTAAVSRWEC
jgi:hypothetical protein